MQRPTGLLSSNDDDDALQIRLEVDQCGGRTKRASPSAVGCFPSSSSSFFSVGCCSPRATVRCAAAAVLAASDAVPPPPPVRPICRGHPTAGDPPSELLCYFSTSIPVGFSGIPSLDLESVLRPPRKDTLSNEK
ncbi:hypothetical protein EVAR_59679_1 [Eumeta japonica]|uniref:Uncharacterized protein n=1 Tax=Eumeta variegata TaxID=151549 RepID=A0A4C1ZNM5_EUMVA|nr:hypothetical protein EVAR_59679_1 [Eumeta japonica]